MKPEQGNVLSTVKSTLRILRSFKMDQPQKGVRELAAELGIGKSSVQRILNTLASEGFVKKNEETKKYELGVSVLELNSIVLGNIDLHTEALPIIKNVVAKCNESCHLAVLENLQVVYLCRVTSENASKVPSHSGLHVHPHCTSSGKLLLAYNDPAFAEAIIDKGLTKYTDKTISDPTLFREELAWIASKGYSVSKGELRPEVTTVSAPIRNYYGKVVSAINLVGLTSRMTNQRIDFFVKELIYAGESISEKLGYRKR